MAGDGPDRLLMALALGDAFVEASDVAARRAAAIETDRVRGFDESPLKVAVDVWAGGPEARFPPAGVDAWCGASIAASFSAVGNRATSPTSSAMTTASVRPTPGRVRRC